MILYTSRTRSSIIGGSLDGKNGGGVGDRTDGIICALNWVDIKNLRWELRGASGRGKVWCSKQVSWRTDSEFVRIVSFNRQSFSRAIILYASTLSESLNVYPSKQLLPPESILTPKKKKGKIGKGLVETSGSSTLISGTTKVESLQRRLSIPGLQK